MTPFPLLKNVKRVLCLGAHSDDIEIGAGATVLRLLRESVDVDVTWCVLSANGVRRDEAQGSAAVFCAPAKRWDVVYGAFRDGFFPTQLSEIKETFEALKPFAPDLVLTHTRDDRHQDHRVVSDLTWNTFRSTQIWEYEIPKWDGDLGRPNLYVPADDELVARKLEVLSTNFASQRSKHWYDEETFRGLMRLRGLESNCRYAEAFYVRKMVVS